MAMETSWRIRANPQDWISLVCAALLFLTPWAFKFTGDMGVARTAWISGVVVAAFAIAALLQFAEWEEWVTVILGLWVIVAPWVIGFTAMSSVTAAFVILGAVIALSSISEIWMIHRPRPMLR